MDCSVVPRLNTCAYDMSVWSMQHCNNMKIYIEDCRHELDYTRGISVR